MRRVAAWLGVIAVGGVLAGVAWVSFTPALGHWHVLALAIGLGWLGRIGSS